LAKLLSAGAQLLACFRRAGAHSMCPIHASDRGMNPTVDVIRGSLNDGCQQSRQQFKVARQHSITGAS
jgi:hypothetical protein